MRRCLTAAHSLCSFRAFDMVYFSLSPTFPSSSNAFSPAQHLHRLDIFCQFLWVAAVEQQPLVVKAQSLFWIAAVNSPERWRVSNVYVVYLMDH